MLKNGQTYFKNLVNTELGISRIFSKADSFERLELVIIREENHSKFLELRFFGLSLHFNEKKTSRKPIKCQCCPHIKTSQLNCTANQ